MAFCDEILELLDKYGERIFVTNEPRESKEGSCQMEIVTHGKCTNCGEPIKDNGLFLCEKCRENNITETTMHHFTCAWCDNEKCVKGTKECEFEKWKKNQESEEEDGSAKNRNKL